MARVVWLGGTASVLVAPVVAGWSAAILVQVLLVAVSVGALWIARRRGLREIFLAAPAVALVFVVTTMVRALVGDDPFRHGGVAGVWVMTLSLLWGIEVARGGGWRLSVASSSAAAGEASPGPRHLPGAVPPGRRDRPGLVAGPAPLILATVALLAFAVRGVMVGVTTHHDAAFAWAATAVLAVPLMWRRPAPAGTLLATLVLGLLPGFLLLGAATEFALWRPVTLPAAIALGVDTGRWWLLLLWVVVASPLALALVVRDAGRPVVAAGAGAGRPAAG